jgi:hypothetical protein
MLRWTFIGLMVGLVVSSAHAEIYRSVDAKGNVLFSDIPAANAERVRLPPLSIVPGMSAEDLARANSRGEAAKQNVSRPNSYKVSFTSPSANQSFRKPSDIIEVAVDTDVDLVSGDQMNLFLDNAPLTAGFSASIPTESLDRGAHVITARVMSNGRVIGEQSVTVYVQQVSKLNQPQAKKKSQ